MATAKSTPEPEPAATEESGYTKDGTDGKPPGPDVDKSFSIPVYDEVKTDE